LWQNQSKQHQSVIVPYRGSGPKVKNEQRPVGKLWIQKSALTPSTRHLRIINFYLNKELS